MSQPTNIPTWMRTVPPLRWVPGAPPKRRRHHTSLHHAYHHPVEATVVGGARATGGCLAAMLLLCVWMVALEIWLLEVTIWAEVWMLYGAFLGCRWIYRHNIIGRTASTASTATGRRTVRAPYDPHGAP